MQTKTVTCKKCNKWLETTASDCDCASEKSVGKRFLMVNVSLVIIGLVYLVFGIH